MIFGGDKKSNNNWTISQDEIFLEMDSRMRKSCRFGVNKGFSSKSARKKKKVYPNRQASDDGWRAQETETLRS